MRSRCVALPIVLALAAGAGAQETPAAKPDPRIDAATGRMAAVWAHPRHFDFIHMALDLDFPDLAQPTFKGVETLTLQAIGIARDVIELDSHGPVVSAATLDGAPVPYEQPEGKLVIRPAVALAPGAAHTLVLTYDCDYSKNHGDGLTWSKAEPEAKSLTRQAVQVHSQGEAESNSRWFPCHDFPNEKLTSEIWVTVADGYEVVSNGHLESCDPVPGAPGRTRWHWVQDKVHPNYLVALAIAKFAVIDLGGPESGRPGLSFPVYTPVGTEENVKPIFGNTPKMVAFFETIFDEPYPWDKYAQVMVRDFSAGGMENTSCTFLTVGTSRAGEAGSRDDLISHELAHQWFGDLATCKTWAHLWLNEGWATYCEALWDEHKAADEATGAAKADAGRRAYLATVMGALRGQRGRNRGMAPEQTAIVSNRYKNPDAVFTKADDPYGKGCMVLHMLRERLGDDMFFKGTRLYLDRYKFSNAETDDFRRCFEEVSGQSLERFFSQWLMRPGMARLAVDLDWDDAGKALSVDVAQTQRVDRLNPAYAFALPVYVTYDDGKDEWLDVKVEAKDTKAQFTLRAKPKQVAIDPNLTVFAATQVRKPLAMLLEEVEHGVTLPTRVLAADSLRALGTPQAEAALARIVQDPDAPAILREAAGGGATAMNR